MNMTRAIFASLCTFAFIQAGALAQQPPEGAIQPYAQNPRYWEYKGAPVLLLGGSKDDSIFQIPDLKAHLEEIQAAGANYVRNTMTERKDHGFEVFPFAEDKTGQYDLNKWNPEYWKRFKNLLEWSRERDIIVQIEVWDRFDYAQDNWAISPWRPANNVNYGVKESGLSNNYPAPAYRDQQPFFHTVPGMPLYAPELEVVRKYQEQLVSKMLSYSLDYPNVLYCMDNETSTPVAWGVSWIKFIRDNAAERGVRVYTTDMFDDGWKPEQSEKIRYALEHPGLYDFLDISQVNSRNFNQDHWDHEYWIVQQMEASPKVRPLNHVKIYSDGNYSFGTGTPVDGVERFWRNLIAGSASSRFHRPDAGIGLNETAKACIGSARKLETRVKLWDVAPRPDLLGERESDEAYLAAKPGQSYALVFTDGGEVTLDLRKAPGTFALKWIDVGGNAWGGSAKVEGGVWVSIAAPGKGPWVAALTLK